MTTQEKKDLKLYNANIHAYADLVQCCSSDKVSFQKMLTSRTKDLKRGDAKLAWDYMIKMYAGIDTTDKMKLEKRFNESKMVPGTNPDIWITDLERLRQHLLECGKKLTMMSLSSTYFTRYHQSTKAQQKTSSDSLKRTKITYTKV